MEMRTRANAEYLYRGVLGVAVLLFLILTDFRVSSVAILAMVLLGILCVGMFFLKDCRLLTFPFLILCFLFSLCYDSFHVFVWMIWVAPFVVAAVLVRLWRLSPRFRPGPSFLPLCAVALATTLGGLGAAPVKTYFEPFVLYSTLGLGVGALLFYLLLKNEFRGKEAMPSFRADLAALAFLAAAAVSFCHLTDLRNILTDPYDIGVQWQNNAATMIMLGLPAVFAGENKRLLHLLLGCLTYGGLLLSLSGGAWLFGSIEFALCVVFFLTRRKTRCELLCGAGVLAFLAAGVAAGVLLVSRFGLTDSLRASLSYRLAYLRDGVSDFLENPVFGKGMGLYGETAARNNITGKVHWYHVFPAQVIGSFGILGALAWGWQLAVRGRLAFRVRRSEDFYLPLCYLGLLLMSLVNPGEFCPLPYGFLAVGIFAALENAVFPEERYFLGSRSEN